VLKKTGTFKQVMRALIAQRMDFKPIFDLDEIKYLRKDNDNEVQLYLTLGGI